MVSTLQQFRLHIWTGWKTDHLRPKEGANSSRFEKQTISGWPIRNQDIKIWIFHSDTTRKNHHFLVEFQTTKSNLKWFLLYSNSACTSGRVEKRTISGQRRAPIQAGGHICLHLELPTNLWLTYLHLTQLRLWISYNWIELPKIKYLCKTHLHNPYNNKNKLYGP